MSWLLGAGSILRHRAIMERRAKEMEEGERQVAYSSGIEQARLREEELASENILSELSVDQIDAVDNPQIIQRVKGAKYILEIERYDNRPISPEEIERTRETFKRWWEGDAPFLIVHRPARISVIMLPEAAD